MHFPSLQMFARVSLARASPKQWFANRMRETQDLCAPEKNRDGYATGQITYYRRDFTQGAALEYYNVIGRDRI